MGLCGVMCVLLVPEYYMSNVLNLCTAYNYTRVVVCSVRLQLLREYCEIQFRSRIPSLHSPAPMTSCIDI